MFTSKAQANALVGICAEDEGIAVARVGRDKAASPVLQLCQYHASVAGESPDTTLSKLVKSASLDKYRCTSPLGLGCYSLLLVEAPDVPPAELRAAMRWRVRDLIDFHVDDAIIDVFEIADDDAKGRNRLMYAVAARADTVKQQVDLLLDAGLKLTAIDIPELSLRNIASLLPEDVAGVALLYLGTDGGLIVITHQGRLYLSRYLEASRFEPPGPGAEGAADTSTQSWLDGIVVELQRSMDYYERHFAMPPVANTVVAPMRYPVEGMTDYMAGQLGIPVRELDLNGVIDGPEPLQKDKQWQCLLAIGAALRQEGRTL